MSDLDEHRRYSTNEEDVSLLIASLMRYQPSMSVFEAMSTLFQPMIAIFTFALGLHLHLRVIKISMKEKDLTWKLDVFNSSLLIGVFFYSMVIHIVTLFISDVHKYTGDWFCYGSKVVIYIGFRYMHGHTLVVSILKYVMIVQWQKARDVGHDQIKKIFFWINILHPLLDACTNLFVSPDFFWSWDVSPEITRCLGDQKHLFSPNFNTTPIRLHDICNALKPPAKEAYPQYGLYVLRKGICWTHIVFFYSIMGNALEMIAYIRIFWFMRR